MSQQLAIDALRSEIARLQGALDILDPVKRLVALENIQKRRGRPLGSKNATKPVVEKPKRKFTKAQKKEISARMLKYWKGRKAA